MSSLFQSNNFILNTGGFKKEEKPESLEYVAYLCKLPWTPTALCSPTSLLEPISVYDTKRETKTAYTAKTGPFLINKAIEGNVEVTVALCPGGYQCDREELTVYLLPEDKDAIDCLLCIPACDENIYQAEGIDAFRMYLLELHNQARTTHPDECDPNSCKQLEIDQKINTAAQWKADDFVIWNYYSHTDHLGRNPGQMLTDFGVEWQYCGENIACLELINQPMPSYEELAERFFEMWMNSPHHRANIMNATYNLVGFGLSFFTWVDKQGNKHIKIYAVVDFVSREKKAEEPYIPKPSLECFGECVQKIRWEQAYVVVDGQKQPLPYLITRVKIPRLCSIEKLEFIFEQSPCSAVYIPSQHASQKKQPIPEDNSLKFIWGKDMPDGEWVVRWDLSSNCFVPGEWMAVYAWVKDYQGKCNPFLLAWGWFETQCWTSGIIQGCGLLDEDGNLIEGGLGQSLKGEWIGDERLHWLVEFKGNLYWLKCSDYAEYAIGERCFIHKDGLSMYRDEKNEVTQDPACRWPYCGDNIPQEDEILSDSNVAYTLDRNRDVIVPQTFWGIGA